MKTTKNAFRGVSLMLGASAAAIAATAPAFAQGDSQETDDQIVVTGTRIQRDPNLTEPLPVQTVGAEQIRLSGEPDLTDVINDIPSLLTATTAEGSIDGTFEVGGVGSATLNLRGLGAERTLVLVNGRRHVGGVAGTAIVDINSIPNALVERVDVLTGGASQVYGADAVTGVVNFVLKRDFEGLSLNASGGISGEGDGERYAISGVAGKNFFDDRLNVTAAFDYSKRNDIRFGDRDFSRDNGISRGQPNPDRRFQSGDIGSSTPNFAQFYSPANGFFPRGFTIPSAVDFVSDYTAAFGMAPNLTQAELDLISRGETSPTRAILPQPTFSVSSERGVIAPGDFSSPAVDLDGNGTPDCLDSYVGYNSSLDFANSFGIVGGCWTVNDDGSVRPVQDGLIAGVFNGFGGDGVRDNYDATYLTPDLENIVGNLMISYDIADNVRWFFEGKFAKSTAEFGSPLNTFYDLLTIAPDNPFIPTELAGVAASTGGLFVTRDPTDLGPNVDTEERETMRFVTGIEAEGSNGFKYNLDFNYGRFDRTTTDRNRVIMDRYFAAVDATTDAGGNAVCRSDVDPTTSSPTTPFDIPLFDFGYFTFNPGDGSCAPVNVLGGPNAASQAAIDFVTATVTNEFTLEQYVVNGTVVGDLDQVVTLPGGSIGFAGGFEYRLERSNSVFDPLVRGVLPVSTPDGNAGELVSELGGFRQSSLVFDPAALVRNEGGEFDVWEVFAEMQVPILKDQPFFHELTVNGGLRFADYSTVGSNLSWGVSGTWAPVSDIRFRASYAQPIRAPNVTELFAPEQGAFFRPIDPCDQAELDALLSSGDPRGPVREANCRADGIPLGYNDPLSARFSGVTSGNANLEEERAKTFSVGALVQPRFIEGLSMSVDYWSIEITDAIAAVSSQDIVDNCYDSGSFPNQFCGLFTRNRDNTSPQFLGFNFLRQSSVNFAQLEARGIDAQISYDFDVGPNDFNVTVNGAWMERLNNFFDPGDPTAVDPELGEIQRPEFFANGYFNYRRGPFGFQWQTQFWDEQGLGGVELELVDQVFGPAGVTGVTFIHDLNANYQINDRFSVYGGVNNVTNENPFVTEQAFPVSPLGRYFFLGARFDM